MKYTDFLSLLDRGELSGVYIIEGAEEYLKEEMLKSLRNKLLVPGFEMLNETALENCGLDEVIEASETLPFMCEKRLVVAKDPAFFKVTKQTSPNEKLNEWIKRITPTCVVLLYVRGEILSGAKFFDAADKLNRIVHFDLLTEAELIKWAADNLKALGHSAKSNVLNELVFMTGRRMTSLQIEINKLAAAAGARKEITIEDIKAIVTPDVDVKVYEMIDALVDKKGAEAHKLLSQLLDSGENSVMLLSMIIRQLRIYAHLVPLTAAGFSLEEVSTRIAERNNYPLKRAYNKIQRYEGKKRERVIECYKKSIEADFRIKSGQADARSVLEEMMYLIYSAL